MGSVHQIERQTNSSFLGILYAEDFDDPVDQPEPAPEHVEATFTSAEMEAAQAAAGCEAVLLARAAWDAGALNVRAQALDRISEAIKAARDGAGLIVDEVATETAKAMLSVLAGLLPHFCRSHGQAETRALLRHLLPQLTQQPRITVRVHPATLEAVRHDLRDLDPEVAATVTLMPLETLGQDEVRVAWANGSLCRNGNAIADALGAGLAELGLIKAAPGHPTASLPEQHKRSTVYGE